MEIPINPAQWDGQLEYALPFTDKVHTIKHRPHLPWLQIGAFMQDLRAAGEVVFEGKANPVLNGPCARALEFQILTAVRPNEALNARWSEIDLNAKLWNIPKERMKGKKRGHRVPLSEAAIAVLRKQQGKHDELVFPGIGNRAAINKCTVERFLHGIGYTNENGVGIVPHGFRGTFSTWARETMKYHHHLWEMALSHSVRTAVEEAYFHGDMLEQRRPLMEDWARMCDGPRQPAEVIPLHRKVS